MTVANAYVDLRKMAGMMEDDGQREKGWFSCPALGSEMDEVTKDRE